MKNISIIILCAAFSIAIILFLTMRLGYDSGEIQLDADIRAYILEGFEGDTAMAETWRRRHCGRSYCGYDSLCDSMIEVDFRRWVKKQKKVSK